MNVDLQVDSTLGIPDLVGIPDLLDTQISYQIKKMLLSVKWAVNGVIRLRC